jgi:hypothetical protein
VLPGGGDSSHVAAVGGGNHPDAGSSLNISSVELIVLQYDGILIDCFMFFRICELHVHAVWLNFWLIGYMFIKIDEKLHFGIRNCK